MTAKAKTKTRRKGPLRNKKAACALLTEWERTSEKVELVDPGSGLSFPGRISQMDEGDFLFLGPDGISRLVFPLLWQEVTVDELGVMTNIHITERDERKIVLSVKAKSKRTVGDYAAAKMLVKKWHGSKQTLFFQVSHSFCSFSFAGKIQEVKSDRCLIAPIPGGVFVGFRIDQVGVSVNVKDGPTLSIFDSRRDYFLLIFEAKPKVKDLLEQYALPNELVN